jgi:guanylate kinase
MSFLLIISSPSGAGKTTLCRNILREDAEFEVSTSVTTRNMRPGERDGSEYFFVSRDSFHKMIGDGAFLEHAEVFGNLYGTPLAWVEEKIFNGKHILFDIDWQGARDIKARGVFDVVSIFVLPPSIDELERRLRNRSSDEESVIQKRLSGARLEISKYVDYDYTIVNDDLDRAQSEVRAIILAEKIKRRKHSVGGI